MAERLVVIGGDAGGMAAASQARRRNDGLEIVALERGNWTSYSACGIPYLVSGEVGELEELVARTPQEFREQLRIDVRMQHEVMAHRPRRPARSRSATTTTSARSRSASTTC